MLSYFLKAGNFKKELNVMMILVIKNRLGFLFERARFGFRKNLALPKSRSSLSHSGRYATAADPAFGFAKLPLNSKFLGDSRA